MKKGDVVRIIDPKEYAKQVYDNWGSEEAKKVLQDHLERVPSKKDAKINALTELFSNELIINREVGGLFDLALNGTILVCDVEKKKLKL